MRPYLQSGTFLPQFALALFSLATLVPWSDTADAQTVSLDNVTPITLSTSTTLSAVRIDPQTGNVFVRSSAANYNVCTQPAGPTINSFAPSSATVAPSTTITLNWTSSNATSCSPQQGGTTVWSSLGTLPATGSQNVTAPATNGSITFQLSCTNGSQTVSQTTQVAVQTSGGSCVPLYPNGTTSSWDSVFAAWPAYGVRRRMGVPANGYVAFQFTATFTAGQFGTIATGDFPNDGDGIGQMSISREPGCFTQSQLGSFCLGPVARLPGVGWQNGSASPFSCALTPGQIYYVNFTYGSGTVGPGPHCPAGSGACSADMQNQIQD
ncbi:MAG TPA: hypothetical protein VN259_11445 [Xanthomonadales bacterium]|nr:hypothetical protein [Xanthomonadales bacterium]